MRPNQRLSPPPHALCSSHQASKAQCVAPVGGATHPIQQRRPVAGAHSPLGFCARRSQLGEPMVDHCAGRLGTFASRQHHLPGCATSQGAPGPRRAVRSRRSAVGALRGGEEARDVARQHVRCPRAPPPQLTLLLWFLAHHSGLRRWRHASTTSAPSAMLLCACM